MASDVLDPVAADIRENLISTAVKFLSNPNVQRCTLESKERFLRSKGLSDLEIQKAIEKYTELIDLPAVTSELMFFHRSRRSWFRDNVLPIVVYGGLAYGCFWFYKNCLRHWLFVQEPQRKSTEECLDELRKSLDILNSSVMSLRTELQATTHQNTMRSQLDTIKTDITSVKGILLNRNQFPSLKTRSEPPSIPAWQRQSQEATSTEPNEEKKKTRVRNQRSESGGSNSSEGEQATKNSDSSLEIIMFATKKKVNMTDKPKRPMSAYMLWLNSAREQIKSDNPGLKVTEIAKKGGEIWRSMKDKSEWEEKAAQAKEQYTKYYGGKISSLFPYSMYELLIIIALVIPFVSG